MIGNSVKQEQTRQWRSCLLYKTIFADFARSEDNKSFKKNFL